MALSVRCAGTNVAARVLAAWLATSALLLGAAPQAWGQPASRADSIAAPAPDTAAAPVAMESIAVARAAERLSAAAQAATPESVAVSPVPSIPIFLGGRQVYTVRTGRDGLSLSERVRAIQSRLRQAITDDATSADSVRLIRTPEGIEVRLGRHVLWLIVAADLGSQSSEEFSDWIAVLPATISEGVLKERESRRPVRLLISTALAALLTLVAWVLARLLFAASVRWSSLLHRVLPRYVRGIRIRSFEILSKHQIVGMVRSVLARVDLVVGALLLYGYLTLLFSLFPWTQGWSWLLVRLARTFAIDAIRSVASAIPGLLVIAVIVFLFGWITKLAGRFFDDVDAGTLTIPGLHRELARPSKRLVRILLWIIAAMIAYPYIPGSQSKAVQGVSILLGVMVSLGSTGFVGNVISGIVLTYSRSFRVGDRVRIGEVTGDVVSLGFFATKLRTIRNEEVTLPNGHVAAHAIVNYTRLSEDEGLVLHTEVTIGYDVDWRRVHALLLEAAGKVEGVESDPAPRVYQRSLNDCNVSYELNAVTRRSHAQLQLYSDLHQEIQDAFAAAGIEILSPAFQAIRDGNAATLPGEPKGPRRDPGAFRVETKGRDA